ncbi:unnamed protein product [Prorocentrum cordatum]|uniref:Uncharacterized protein n=1 Tax=Prorocentrum cordatum TaxID=2364126 RepID=A0ABN9QVU3_9DINO|nr:unnamed protein product [Polarella glacialis]
MPKDRLAKKGSEADEEGEGERPPLHFIARAAREPLPLPSGHLQASLLVALAWQLYGSCADIDLAATSARFAFQFAPCADEKSRRSTPLLHRSGATRFDELAGETVDAFFVAKEDGEKSGRLRDAAVAIGSFDKAARAGIASAALRPISEQAFASDASAGNGDDGGLFGGVGVTCKTWDFDRARGAARRREKRRCEVGPAIAAWPRVLDSDSAAPFFRQSTGAAGGLGAEPSTADASPLELDFDELDPLKCCRSQIGRLSHSADAQLRALRAQALAASVREQRRAHAERGQALLLGLGLDLAEGDRPASYGAALAGERPACVRGGAGEADGGSSSSSSSCAGSQAQGRGARACSSGGSSPESQSHQAGAAAERHGLTFLRRLKVGKAESLAFDRELAEWVERPGAQNFLRASASTLDASAAEYMDGLFWAGYQADAGSTFPSAPQHRRPGLVRGSLGGLGESRAALAGFRARSKMQSRSPPAKPCFLGAVGLSILEGDLEVAVALLAAWDAMLRPPVDLLEVTGASLTGPGRGPLPRRALSFHPEGAGRRSKTQGHDAGAMLLDPIWRGVTGTAASASGTSSLAREIAALQRRPVHLEVSAAPGRSPRLPRGRAPPSTAWRSEPRGGYRPDATHSLRFRSALGASQHGALRYAKRARYLAELDKVAPSVSKWADLAAARGLLARAGKFSIVCIHQLLLEVGFGTDEVRRQLLGLDSVASSWTSGSSCDLAVVRRRVVGWLSSRVWRGLVVVLPEFGSIEASADLRRLAFYAVKAGCPVTLASAEHGCDLSAQRFRDSFADQEFAHSSIDDEIREVEKKLTAPGTSDELQLVLEKISEERSDNEALTREMSQLRAQISELRRSYAEVRGRLSAEELRMQAEIDGSTCEQRSRRNAAVAKARAAESRLGALEGRFEGAQGDIDRDTQTRPVIRGEIQSLTQKVVDIGREKEQLLELIQTLAAEVVGTAVLLGMEEDEKAELAAHLDEVKMQVERLSSELGEAERTNTLLLEARVVIQGEVGKLTQKVVDGGARREVLRQSRADARARQDDPGGQRRLPRRLPGQPRGPAGGGPGRGGRAGAGGGGRGDRQAHAPGAARTHPGRGGAPLRAVCRHRRPEAGPRGAARGAGRGGGGPAGRGGAAVAAAGAERGALRRAAAGERV